MRQHGTVHVTLNKLTFLRVSLILSSIFKISFLKISFYSTTCTLLLVLLPSDKQKTLDRASLQFLGFGATQQCSLAAVPQRVCSKNHLAAPAVTFRKQVPLALHTVPSPESYSPGCLLPSSQISLFLFISVPLKTATASIYIYSRASYPSQREDSLLLLVGNTWCSAQRLLRGAVGRGSILTPTTDPSRSYRWKQSPRYLQNTSELTESCLDKVILVYGFLSN